MVKQWRSSVPASLFAPFRYCFSRRKGYLHRVDRGARHALRLGPPILSMYIYWVMIVALASAGCGANMRETEYLRYRQARDQFRSETTCPSDQIRQWPRNDLSGSAYDLEGCGKRARYNCTENLYGRTTCVSVPIVGAFAVSRS